MHLGGLFIRNPRFEAQIDSNDSFLYKRVQITRLGLDSTDKECTIMYIEGP